MARANGRALYGNTSLDSTGAPLVTDKLIEDNYITWRQSMLMSLGGRNKISWQWLPFTSSARKDNLQLYHWVKVVNGVPPTGDYSFAKYNKSVDIIKYTDDEYDKHLIDPNWTKEETDQLFDLCERFDLRFIVIADRFPFPRSMEELKSRYYAVSRALVIARAPSSGDVSHHPLVKDNYNITQEIERRRALSTVLSHSKQQDNKDAEILAEAKRIVEARLISKGGEGSELPVSASGVSDGTIGKANAPVDSVSPSSNQSPPTAVVTPPALTAETHSTPASLRMLRVYLRTTVLDQMAQAASSSAGLRTIKRVDQTLQELRKFQSAKTPPAQGYRTIVASRGFPAGFWEKAQIILSRSRSSQVNVKPKVPTKAVCAEHLELRKEILALLNLQKQMQYKEAEASAHRDNSYDMAPTPCTPKRSHRGGDQERPFLQDSGGFAGERVGKREHKRKAPGRFSEAPPSPPQTKRARKLKAADG